VRGLGFGVGLLLLATLKDPCERIPDPPPARETTWSNVDVDVSIFSPEYERTSTVRMRLLRNGQPAVLPPRSRVSCQGIRLESSAEGYTAVLRTSQRRNPEYCCDFVGGEGRDVASLCIPAPERPQFSLSLEGEALPRREDVVIHYYPSNAPSDSVRMRVSATGGEGNERRELTFDPRPDDGDYPIDGSSFPPGAGTITLTRELEQNLPVIGFRSARAKVATSLTVHVNWK